MEPPPFPHPLYSYVQSQQHPLCPDDNLLSLRPSRPDRRIIMEPPTLLTDWHHCGPICSSSFFFSSQGPSSGNRHYHHHHCPPSPLSHPRRRLRMPQNHSRPVFVFVVGRPSDCLLVIRSRDGGSGQKGKLGGGGKALRSHIQEMNFGDR